MKTFLAAILLLATSLHSIAADLTGRWYGKVDNNEIALNLKVEGKKLTGTIFTADGDGPISNTKVTGPSFAFSYATNGVIIPFTGTFDGDKMELTMVVQ